MKLSARNKLPGVIERIDVDGLTAKVTMRVGDNCLVAVITREAVEDMALTIGDTVSAVIKSTSVMLAKD
ncbi:MAG TPA: TOBE domain-containing protein [Candidatus Eremiobacteraceae bacterium]|nr:TOBE domain-containing protein [Candidatus Eremiobacteraceae bacterium]